MERLVDGRVEVLEDTMYAVIKNIERQRAVEKMVTVLKETRERLEIYTDSTLVHHSKLHVWTARTVLAEENEYVYDEEARS